MSDHELLVYVDGSCYPNPGPGGYGIRMEYRGKVKEHHGGRHNTTNNQMELQAVISATRLIKWKLADKLDFKVVFLSDSAYVVKGISEFCAGWKRRGWKKSDGGEPSNLEMWKEVYDLLIIQHRGKYKMKKVKGHSGLPGNERADELANMGRASVTS